MPSFHTIRPISGVVTGLAVAVAMAAIPAAAQSADAPQETSEKVNLVYVYGDDPCQQSSDNVIVVCARLPEGDRYRIPEDLRYSDDPANVSWSTRTQSLETVGSFGTLSCSPVGAGGFTGCTQDLINSAYAEKENSPDVRFSVLIEEERRKRLENIDEDAAAEQARVEQIEREYMRRLEEERAANPAGVPLPSSELPSSALPNPEQPSPAVDDPPSDNGPSRGSQ